MILNGVSSIGDVIFLFFAALATLEMPHGGILSGILFGLNAAVQIFIAPLTARKVDKISYAKRWSWAVFFSLLLVFAALLPGLLPPRNPADYLVLCILLVFIHVFNNVSAQLKMELPFRLSENGNFELSKFTSIGNLMTRGVYCAAPLLANLIPGKDWFFAASVNSFSFLFAALAALFGRFYFRDITSQSFKKETAPQKEDIKRLARWNTSFLFLTNLSIGGVALVLTALMKEKTNIPIFQWMTPVSSLYLGAAIALVVTLFFSSRGFIERANINRLLSLTVMTFLLLGLSSSNNPITTLTALFLSGLSYGFSLVAMGPAVTRHFNGNSRVSLISQSQAFGRVGTILSSLLLGFLLDRHIGIRTILLLVSFSGLLSIVWFYQQKKRLAPSY